MGMEVGTARLWLLLCGNGRFWTASPEHGHPRHLCFPGQQQGHELSNPVTGINLKIKTHDTLLGRKSTEKSHPCFILSFQFESDLQIFLTAIRQVICCKSQVHAVLTQLVFVMGEVGKWLCPIQVRSTGKGPGAASTETSQHRKRRI